MSPSSLRRPAANSTPSERRRWWDYAIVAAAVAVFLWLGLQARVPEIAMNRGWLLLLVIILAVSLLYCGLRLRRQTGFS